MTFVKYKFVKYNEKYPKLYKKEETKIRKILGSNIIIEHVGSTSIKELGGKGIIDIIIQTPKNKINLFVNKLKSLGYTCNKEHQKDKRRIFLQKKIVFRGNERRIHIHLTLTKPYWDSFIIFREYLRNNKKAREEYTKIKKKAAKYSKQEGKIYRAYKEECIKKIIKEAKKEII